MFPAVAGEASRRVACFAKACRDNGTYHMGRSAPAKKWFHDNILLDLTLPDTEAALDGEGDGDFRSPGS